MTEAHLFVIGILLAWLAGIRVYLTVFGVGLAGLLGWVELPPALQATESWWVLGTSAALAITEFFADKIPGVDSAWDLVQTLARVPAGAFLAAATLSPNGELSGTALAAGAGVALASHGLKSGTAAQHVARTSQQLGGLGRRGHRRGGRPGAGAGAPLDRTGAGGGLQPGRRAGGLAGLAHAVERHALVVAAACRQGGGPAQPRCLATVTP
jgi:uncharacterized membrane protein